MGLLLFSCRSMPVFFYPNNQFRVLPYHTYVDHNVKIYLISRVFYYLTSCSVSKFNWNKANPPTYYLISTYTFVLGSGAWHSNNFISIGLPNFLLGIPTLLAFSQSSGCVLKIFMPRYWNLLTYSCEITSTTYLPHNMPDLWGLYLVFYLIKVTKVYTS